ncbi:uncharacterized protein LOC141898800 [Tubulanus polymorphus]|uniref:uncharacterized protein LOC141898800 n=1 Tax=Tubulanus polymorphus TaxID=672921 RepID=UPI003DA6AD1A
MEKLLTITLLIMALVINCSGQDTLAQDTCDASKSAVNLFPNAPVVIVGLFDIRIPGNDGSGCGTPDPVILPAYEAAKWALTEINTINYAGVQIGMKVFDTCGQASVANRAAMEFYPSVYTNKRTCSDGNQLVLGILGASHSSVSLGVADWSGKFEVAQISPMSTAATLSDKNKYPYFMRTIPPDTMQTKVMIEVLKKLNWKYIGLVYSDDAYGSDGKKQFIMAAGEAGICINIALPVRTFEQDPPIIEGILTQLLSTNITGVVYFGHYIPALEIMKINSTIEKYGRLQWIFSDAVGVSNTFATGQQYARGYVSVSPSSRTSTEFENSWLGIDINNPANDPWYRDWYMYTHNCKLAGVTYEPYASLPNVCPPLTTAQKQQQYIQNQYVSSTIDAVYTYADALKRALRTKCEGNTTICQTLESTSTKEFFQNYVKTTSITNEGINSSSAVSAPFTSEISFDTNGDIIGASYVVWSNILNGATTTLQRVGYYMNDQLTLNLTKLKMYDSQRTNVLASVPKSICPASGCGFCLSLNVASKFYIKPGDIIINGVFSVHETENGAYCTRVKNNGAQLMTAFVYAISKAKLGGDINLGALGIDDCGSSNIANGLVASFQNNLITVMDSKGNVINPSQVEAYTAAHDSSTTISVAEVLSPLRIPQVGYRATSAALSDKRRFPFFLRTVPNDGYQAQVIASFLKNQGWTHVQTIQAPTSYGRAGIDAFIKYAEAEGRICVTATLEFGTDGTCLQLIHKLSLRVNAKVVVVFADVEQFRCLLGAMKTSNMGGKLLLFGSENWGTSNEIINGYEDIAVGTFTTKLKSPPLPSFIAYLQSVNVLTEKENPFFRDWYESLYNCYLTAQSQVRYPVPCDASKEITDAPGFAQDPVTLNLLNAVQAIVTATNSTLEYYCGQNYNTVCNAYRTALDRKATMLEFIRKAQFTDEAGRLFTFINDEGVADYEIYNYQAAGYVKVGEYSGKNLSMTGTPKYYGNKTITSMCPASLGNLCKICISRYQTKFMYIPGDVLIGGLFNIHWPGPTPYSCGDLKDFNGFQSSEAFAFAIKSINNGTAPVKLNGVRLGGVGLDSCSSDFMAANLISGIHSNTVQLSNSSLTVDQSNIRGWVTYGSDITAKVAEIVGRLHISQISPSATSTSLSDVATYPTLYRTVPTDDIQTLAIAKFVRALGFTCVQAVYSRNIYGRSAIIEFKNNMLAQRLCLSSCYELSVSNIGDVVAKLAGSTSKVVVVLADADKYVNQLLKEKQALANATNLLFIGSESWATIKKAVKGVEGAAENAMTMKVDFPVISNFTKYLSDKNPTNYKMNPWFNEYYQYVYGCNIGQTCETSGLSDAPDFEQDNWVLSTINAVYAFGQAVHLTLEEECGANYKGVCANFISAGNLNDRILQNLGKVSFQSLDKRQFVFVNRAAGNGYKIFRYKGAGYEEVATYVRHQLSFTQPEVLNTSRRIPSTCSPCVECNIRPKAKEKFLYIPGDILIGGIFDASIRGLQPFTCGNVNPVAGFQLTEAFAFAIEQINKHQGIFHGKLKGVTLGGIAMDSCQSAIRAGNLMADFHSRVFKLTKSTEEVDPTKVVGYVGDLTSLETEHAAKVLTKLKIPLVSYGATSLELSDRKKYPYFLRTVPADDKLANAIVSFLLKYKINAVQVVSSTRHYSVGATKEFVKLAKSKLICISQHLIFNETQIVTQQSALEVANELLNRPNATVVVIILETEFINPLLRATEKMILKYPNSRTGRFFFIGSETWGSSPEVIRGIKYGLGDGVTFSLATSDIPEFDVYLDSKFPNTYERNPWFNSYYEYMFNCTIPGNVLSYPRQCSSISQSVVRNSKYHQDQFTMYVINAVYTLAYGIHETLRNKCGPNYDGICDNYRQGSNQQLDIYKYAKTINFTDATNKPFYYKENGDSIRGYHVYALRQSIINRFIYNYQNIGYYPTVKDGLTIASTYNPNWQSDCEEPEWCVMCPYIWHRKTRYMQTNNTGLNMVGLFNVHEQNDDNYLICGDMQITQGFQRVMAFFYAIDLVNANTDMKFKMGGLAIDICSNNDRLHEDYFTYINKEGLCSEPPYEALIAPQTVFAYMTMASPESIISGPYMKSIGATYISPSASAPTLSDKTRFPYFLRTVPPDNLQAIAMASILRTFNWTYFLGVNTDSDYGNGGMDALWKIANATNSTLCMGARYKIDSDASVEDAMAVVMKLLKHEHAKVVVLFATGKNTRSILKAVQRMKVKDRFIWLGGDDWASEMEVVEDVESTAAGALTIEVRSFHVQSFISWLTKLSFQNRRGIPLDWFEEYWQHVHKCRIQGSRVVLTKYVKQCLKNETITPNMVKYESATLHIIISTYIAAKGLSRISDCAAAGSFSACVWKLKKESRNSMIYNQIKSAVWTVLPSDLGSNRFDFTFTNEGYGNPGYFIYNFRYNTTTKKYEYVKIGSWRGQLDLSMDDYIGPSGEKKTEGNIPASFCPHGVDCGCASGAGRLGGNRIKPAPGKYDQFNTALGLVLAILSGIGFIISIFCFIFFICFYPKRGMSTVLGYMLIIGVLLMYAVNFAFIFHPCPVVCTIRRFCLGIVYAICYSSMAVKVMNTWRVEGYDETSSASYKRFSHPFGLFCITIGLIFVQVIIAIEWIVLEPPNSEQIIYELQYWPRCTPSDFHNEGLVLSMTYVMFLQVLVAIFSGLTWTSDENNQESRWILGANCVGMGSVLVWTIVSTMTPIEYRDAAVAIGTLVAATAILILVFFRKMNILRKYRNKQASEKEKAKSQVHSLTYDNDAFKKDDDDMLSDKPSSYRS